jgi:hypothetical protein
MEDNAFLGEFIAGFVYLIVAARLFRLSRRSGEIPERLLAASFLCMAVSEALYTLPNLAAFESLWTPLNFAGRLAVIPDVVLLALFTRRVFRPDERWGAWLVWCTAAFIVTGVGGSALAGDWEGFSIGSGWFWLEWIGFTLPFAWTAVDTFIQFLQAGRRVRIGLCDRLVCNRYLLWTLFSLFQVGLCVIILPQYAEFEATNEFSAKWDAVYGAFGVASLVMIWFVFFPPIFYRRWISGAAPTAAGIDG